LNKKYLIKFIENEWSNTGVGVRSKKYVSGTKRIRLVEFTYGFVEPDWCIKGHIGYVLEGVCSIDFNGTIIRLSEGDGLWIEEGEENRHKLIVGSDERVLFVLFESL
jgi:quercetin dioxygenase-like cupin family protein